MAANTQTPYNFLSKLIHWVSALIVVGLFLLGDWMMGLDYYSEWYQQAPYYHQSVGIVLFLITLLRIMNIAKQPKTHPLERQPTPEQFIAKVAHKLLYLLLVSLFISGYLISTEDGSPIEFFTLMSIPSLGSIFENQADVAGIVHEYSANFLILLASVHMLAALKHHYFDKDDTLRRMIFTKKTH